MNFASLILAAFFAGLGLGFIKFFFLAYLSTDVYEAGEKYWVIQAVGALITLGPFLAFLIAAPIASSTLKSRVMLISAFSVSLALIAGIAGNWLGSSWLYVFTTGFVMGIFNPAKNAAIPLESSQSGRTTEAVAAALSISYIVGILSGAPLATELFLKDRMAAAVLAVIIFAMAGYAGGRCRYSLEQEHIRKFGESFQELIRDTTWVARRYWAYVLASPMIWGLASAESLAITAYAEQRMLGGPVKCSLMAAYATVGVIIGNIISTRATRFRYSASTICAAGMSCVIIIIPVVVDFMGPSPIVEENAHIYRIVGTLLGVFGVFFGIATNLLEAEYLRHVYLGKKEGTGAALLSALTAFFPFVFGGLIALAIRLNIAGLATQFVLIAAISIIPAGLILFLGATSRRRRYD